MNKIQLVDEGYRLFSKFTRPKNFHDLDPDDPEAWDHDKLLQKRDRRELELEDVANLGFNPISAIKPEGMAYYLPRLIELALDVEKISIKAGEPFLFPFIVFLIPDVDDKQFILLKTKHIIHICDVLEFIKTNYTEFIKENCFEEDLLEAISYWNNIKKA